MQSPDPNIKRKNTSPLRVIVNTWGCLLALFMLLIGTALGLVGAIVVAPQVLGFNLTATALGEEAIVLAATDADLDFRADEIDAAGTALAFAQEGTRAVLNNRADLLDQTATQSAGNVIATNTAAAVQNVARQTQIANDFDSTQAALQSNATQAALDFRNTQAALGIVPTDTDETENIGASSVATSTPLPRFTFDTRGVAIDSERWLLSSPDEWRADNTGWTALSDGAWLLETTPRIAESTSLDTPYTLAVDIRPATGFAGDYWVLFGVGDDTGLAAYFRTETLTITEAGLYQFEVSELANDDALFTDNLTVLGRASAETTLGEQTQLRIELEATEIRLVVADTVLLRADSESIPQGRFGVQLPQDATLRSIGVEN